MFKRRIGPHPHHGTEKSKAVKGCPDIWQLENGDFAIIGLDHHTTLLPHLPDDASCGPDERIVVVPYNVLKAAKPHIS